MAPIKTQRQFKVLYIKTALRNTVKREMNRLKWKKKKLKTRNTVIVQDNAPNSIKEIKRHM